MTPIETAEALLFAVIMFFLVTFGGIWICAKVAGYL